MPSTIFNIATPTSHTPKIHFSHTEIPSTYLDPAQLPSNRIPFRQIKNVQFVRDVTICMPTRLYNALDHTTGNDSGSSAKSRAAPGGRAVKYAKVIMKLADVLEDYDLRTGKYAMLAGPASAGANGVNIHLYQGTLALDMPHTVYQRSGLTLPVTKMASGGRKHEKGSIRYRVEIDLRAPSMVKGRKGFDRLMYAAKNVDGLNEGRIWLCTMLEEYEPTQAKKRKRSGTAAKDHSALSGSDVGATTTSTATASDSVKKEGHPLAAHHPKLVVDLGTIAIQHDVLVPSAISSPTYLATLARRTIRSRAKTARSSLPDVLEEDIHELVEYLGLLFLRSPRITKQDYGKVDPYICRYRLPSTAMPINTAAASGAVSVDDENSEEGEINDSVDIDGDSTHQEELKVEDITTVKYTGFIPSEFVMHLVTDTIKRSRARSAYSDNDEEEGQVREADVDAEAWIAINVNAHRTVAKGGLDGYTILLQSGASDIAEGSTTTTDEPQADVMDVDLRATTSPTSGNGNEKEKKSRQTRGFRYVTCFEFVDAMI